MIWRSSPGNDTDQEPRLLRQAKAEPVARVERFGLEDGAIVWSEAASLARLRRRKVVNAPVGEDTVDIHQEELHLAGAIV